MVYVAVIGDAIKDAHLELAANSRPAGIRLREEPTAAEVTTSLHNRRIFRLGDAASLNFADDTYIMGCSENAVVCSIRVGTPFAQG